MTELEKVIKSFEECLKTPRCQDCPWESCERSDCARAEMPYDLVYAALELLKAEEAKPLRCGGCSWFTQTQESGVGYCSFPNCEREVFDTEYCSWGAWTGKEG